jgi:N-methylhydantoinase A
VATIGAGGGSIARVRHGILAVGPDSAGSTPGPACYARGGTLPTATDADLLLGVLSPDAFAAGRLDVGAAEAAVAEHVAGPLGVSVAEAAWAIRQLLDSRMADLLRRVTIERGHDPREFVLVANGGSGPSHAWALCAELGITTFVVPATATGQSAYGTGTSDLRLTAERSGYLRLAPGAEPDPDQLTALAGELDACVETVRDRLGRHTADIRVERTLSIRYRGQAHHLDVPLEGTALDVGTLAKALDRFEREYEALFGAGSGFRSAGFEVLGGRALGVARMPHLAPAASGDPLRPDGTRPLVFDDPRAPEKVPVYRTERPAPGQEVDGPCLIVYPGQTVVVPPGAQARTTADADLIVTLGSPA